MHSLRIVVVTTLWFMACGILNDQLTIRICPEYFTVFHPRIVDTTDITVIAFAWGIRATWWFGLIIGCLLAVVIRLSRKNLGVRDLLAPALKATLLTACVALLAGLLGFGLAISGFITAVPWVRERLISPEAAFLAVAYWHTALYACAALSGIGLCVWSVYQPFRPRQRTT